MPSHALLRLVSRSSPMALAQVDRVRAELALHRPAVGTEVVPVTTSGDRWKGDLSRLGGKGAFVKEVDAALLTGAADLAVHCLKDIPGDRPPPEGTVIAAYLKRDDVRDALVHPEGLTADQLPDGARIGTSSVRRTAQLAVGHPRLACLPIRGNANSRLARMAAGEVDALVLAVSGLERIGRMDGSARPLPVREMMPPVGAGVLVLACRADDRVALDAATALDDPATRREALAERELLRQLRGHCNAPIAALATTADGELLLEALVFSVDGRHMLRASGRCGPGEPEELGGEVAESLLRQGARSVIDGGGQGGPGPAR